ncbi:tRNA dihydrouridine synthase [Saccharomycopsis crataegensis]|uniref:tRNA-dihydrouridine(16/17) synthase [NAD(P)(+)] n=1 Tax=Saccharomycopsis crataegensis TaxID=43959 RepID=A0AAV5QF67_9ASCO|nr:tRNA dihydrouridine synthase [Saccharomycopsis crataegensis]
MTSTIFFGFIFPDSSTRAKFNPVKSFSSKKPLQNVLSTFAKMTNLKTPTAGSPAVAEASKKPNGAELYELMKRPTKIVAPMVDQSELAWRILSRKYGATLCYTPMLHARLFAQDKKYRLDNFCSFDGDAKLDRPLVVQFCANDPEYLLEAAKHVEDHCDAVDLNLGCPQGIARKGKYGAYLMDEWELIPKLIGTLHENLKVPVTAKIRVYPSNSKNASTGPGQKVANGANDEDFDKEKTLQYARMVLKAGAQILTVHGRTRDMKGQMTGVANWNILKYLYEELSKEFEDIDKKLIFFSNGNILYPEDIQRSLDYIGCQGVMSAEANLYNPGIFSNVFPEGTSEEEIKERQFPRVDKIAREYLEIIKSVQPESVASKHAIKAHFFKLLRPFVDVHKDIRQKIATTSVKGPLEDWEAIVRVVEETVSKIFEDPEIQDKDKIIIGPKEWWGGSYKTIPYWRCQPYFRKVDGKLVVEDIKEKKLTNLENGLKRKQEDGEGNEEGSKDCKKQQTTKTTA